MNILTVSYIEILRQSSVFYMNIHIYIRVYMNIHIYIRIYMNIHIYIRIYIYMNILTQLREESIYSSRGGDILLDLSFRLSRVLEYQGKKKWYTGDQSAHMYSYIHMYFHLSIFSYIHMYSFERM